jgi:MFS family permease
VASVVFNPDQHSTMAGFAIATAVISLPVSLLGPFTGVFIDRWSRRGSRRAPWLRAPRCSRLHPTDQAVLFYAGVLWVLSVNRFYLATAVAVVPRLVPTEDLLMANSMSIVGGTVSLLAGVFVGGWVVDLAGNNKTPVVIAAGMMWLVASGIARRITTPLVPHTLPEAPVRDELQRVVREFADGIGRLVHTPRALGPMTSITLDQFGQGIVLVLSLYVFRDRFQEGVGSFANLIGAGGIGVLLGILTVGKLEERWPKERIVSRAFLAGGVVLIAVSLHVTGWSVLVASFFVGLTFAWKKVPVDTLVQEAVPDGYRGRVFTVYDVAYNVSRVVAAFVAIPLVASIGEEVTVALIGVVFVLYSPVLPRWLARAPEIRLRFYEGARAEEVPRGLVWGGVEERVEVQRDWLEERVDGGRRRYLRLALEDGTVLQVSRQEPDGDWRLERELS